jgi:antitoxin MazE
MEAAVGVKVAEWGNSLAIRIPKDVADTLQIKKGDEIEVRIAGDGALELAKDQRRAEAVARMKAMARSFPPGWKFSRDEIYDR